MLEDSGFVEVQIGEGVDTFGGATGEDKARAFQVYGYAFLAHKPSRRQGAHDVTPEAESLDAPDEQRHDLWVVGDEPCVLLDWSRSANYAEPAG